MKFLPLTTLIGLFAMQINAQKQTSEKAQVTLALLYSSNVSYYGQSTDETLPYVLLNATMRFPNGFSASAGSYKLLSYGGGLSETDLGIGFERDLNEKLTLGVAYTRSFFPANSPLLQASNENNINLSGSYLWSIMKSSLVLDYAFGKQRDIFISFNNSKEISLGTVFNEKNAIYIEPTIELVAGTRRFYENYVVTRGKRDQANGKANFAGKPVPSLTNAAEFSSFNLLSYNFKLPLNFSRANYVAEVSYQFSILGDQADEVLTGQQSFFGLGFYCQF